MERSKMDKWKRKYYLIRKRCADKTRGYFKEGIKSYLTPEDIKFIWLRDKADLMKKPSIDRLDSSKDYTLENCRFIEFRLNSAIHRNNATTYEVAKEIRKKHKSGSTGQELIEHYKLPPTTVYKIIENRIYKKETYEPTT